MKSQETDGLASARGEFETAFERVRHDLRSELGLSWRCAGFGVVLLAATVGFSLARRLRDGGDSGIRDGDA